MGGTRNTVEDRPSCLGFIDIKYDEYCSTECPYTELCTFIAVTEKWPGPKFRTVGGTEEYPIAERNKEEDSGEQEDSPGTEDKESNQS